MDSFDDSGFDIPNDDDSRLLSGSLIHPSDRSSTSTASRHTRGLSLSELSLRNRPPPARSKPKFSLLAQPARPSDSPDFNESAIAEEDEADGADEPTIHMTAEEIENARKLAAKTKEEKLQNDLFILRKLNGAFDVYKEALREAKSSTERVADQLAHTNALLDKYVAILSESERITKLILDERWFGADSDIDQVEREYHEALERAKREEEEKRLAEERERERREREEQEREVREQAERERAESRASSRGSGIRGVRGTRASMRGAATRGATRGASSTASRTGSSIPTAGTRTSRPGSAASTRGSSTTSRGTTRRT